MIHSIPIGTPINIILLSLFVILLYLHFRPKTPVSLPKPPPPLIFRTYTPSTLLPYNGTNGYPVYLAVRGRVFDVTPGRSFYGPVCNKVYMQLLFSCFILILINRVVHMRILPVEMLLVGWLVKVLMKIC